MNRMPLTRQLARWRKSYAQSWAAAMKVSGHNCQYLNYHSNQRFVVKSIYDIFPIVFHFYCRFRRNRGGTPSQVVYACQQEKCIAASSNAVEYSVSYSVTILHAM